MKALHTSCSSGTDGVPAEFFKHAVKKDRRGTVESYLLAPYLAQLFDSCFHQGTAPDDWGVALLTMIHKGGVSSSSSSSYCTKALWESDSFQPHWRQAAAAGK